MVVFLLPSAWAGLSIWDCSLSAVQVCTCTIHPNLFSQEKMPKVWTIHFVWEFIVPSGWLAHSVRLPVLPSCVTWQPKSEFYIVHKGAFHILMVTKPTKSWGTGVKVVGEDCHIEMHLELFSLQKERYLSWRMFGIYFPLLNSKNKIVRVPSGNWKI